jgi:CheY-like chemotaxis protein
MLTMQFSSTAASTGSITGATGVLLRAGLGDRVSCASGSAPISVRIRSTEPTAEGFVDMYLKCHRTPHARIYETIYEFREALYERVAPETIALPKQRTGASGYASGHDPQSSAARRQPVDGIPTIYLIDDEEIVRRSLARLLAQLSLPVRTFASAEEFLAETDATAGGCLILDINLAGMQGGELQRYLIAAAWPLPVIAISGSTDPRVKSEALRLGAAEFFHKPLDADALIAVIRRILGGH